MAICLQTVGYYLINLEMKPKLDTGLHIFRAFGEFSGRPSFDILIMSMMGVINNIIST